MEDPIPRTRMVASRENGLDWQETPMFFARFGRTRGGAKASERDLIGRLRQINAGSHQPARLGPNPRVRDPLFVQEVAELIHSGTL
jgi:hypothetical protein